MFGYADYDRSKFTDVELAIIDDLPHGSGIDYDWHIEKNTRGKVVCYNGYHFMDEYGGYRGTIDFSFRFDVNDTSNPHNPGNGRLMFHTTSGRYWIERLDLRGYLGEMLFGLLDQHIERNCPYCVDGKRDLGQLAQARKELLDETIAFLAENRSMPIVYIGNDGQAVGGVFDCWTCQGTGKLPAKSD